MLADSLDPQLSYIRDSIVSVQVPNRLAFLENLLVTWGSSVQVALSARPSNGRLPVYYAARYGLLDVCQLLKGHMPDANVGDSLLYSDMILLEDRSGISSLSIAVTLDHEEVFEYFLEVLENDGYSNRPNWKSLAGSLLHGAIGSGPKTLGRLLTANADVDYRGVNGETILYAVARSGKATLVGDILSHGASTSIAEGTKGWTPLIVAMVEGHVAMVEMLLQAGADPRYQDFMGWTVLDHAAFRGHNSLAAKLRHLIPSSGPGAISDLKPRPAAPPCIAKNASESVIVVNMGSFDSTKDSTAVDLSLRHQGTPGDLDTEAGFSIRISLIGDQSQSHTVELPILEDMTNRPWAVTTSDPENARLLFQLQRRTTTDTDDKSSYEHLGSAVALLGSLKQCLGHTRESLIRDYTIPILSTATLENIGAITFSFLIVKPFSQPEVNVPKIDMLWDENRQTKVVGHRGHGQNILNPNRLSIGENTKQSVLTAMKMGADLVEDVQLTKDHVPVVYHDFLVSETGIDVWMHHLNLEQLMHISKSQSRPEREAAQQPTHRRSRSYSNDVGEDCRPQHLTEQLKCTFEFKQKGFKANTRGYYIHDSFVTLHNLLSQTPDSIALNIEIKYPMLSEAADEWQSDIYTIEINLFVDTILRDILSHPSCRSRPIMLSSFSPEACIVLSLKQDLFPIWFLSEAGNTPAGDVRASNLQEAIRFATRWNLDGVGIYSDPFVFAPRLVGAAKEKGLMTGSYGILNDDPEGAKVQAAAGIDMLIVDCVRLISQTLSGVHA
ncbi:Glycerophosphoryl diester phosphodiesterase family-domain-containing protein [Aspergillus avenaceus]|uniref:Glycerophosphoryl diester phosphodiesterase family-domain-containing protein n=1 Tax=Aspergillus avenaceus TaxID=36643 RepID=A0A5N6U4Z2_ASPAV|nr:Glycerophosphoryl diester phosphodiesterase family-domain-containing protein [Aspergillus avenaceus]